MKMKFGKIVFLHDTFHLTKDLGVAHRDSGGMAEKPLKKCQKWVLWLYFLNFQEYIKNRNICDTLHCTALLVKIL